MSDKQLPGSDDPASLAEIASLDAYLDSLSRSNAPRREAAVPADAILRAVAAQLRLVQDGAGEPDPAFLERLEKQVRAAQGQPAQGLPKRSRLSRVGFLRAAAGVAAAAGLAGAGYEADEIQRRLRQPKDLVAGEGHWYDIAAVDEVASGQMRAFTAGGVLGYLINDGGRLHAVSAICTHMGCRLKPEQGAFGLRCLCHDSRFNPDGRVLSGLAPDPLPHIALRIDGGRVYAQGTKEDV